MSGQPFLTPGKGGVYLRIHAQPGAKQPAFRGLHGDAIKIAVKEAPEAGKANKAIEAFVAKALALPKSSVTVTSGQTSRSKRLLIEGEREALVDAIELWLSREGLEIR